MSEPKPVKIAIGALGGQGGGVLSGWLIALGEQAGYLVQSTSVPGVAQRTGATIYYVEWFPKDKATEANAAPVMALMPVPGDVDIVLTSEILEAGRAIDRGFVTANTTLISSSHRVYAIGEKIGMGDARIDPTAAIEAGKKAAGRFLFADLEACVERTGSIISSVLFGALAGAGALPVTREAFEQVIRDQQRAVEMNLAGFSAGFDAITEGDRPESPQSVVEPEAAAPAVRYLVDRLLAEFPENLNALVFEGLKKVVDHQDARYGELYLDRVKRFAKLPVDGSGRVTLTEAVAKHLALWMAYDDTIRVADLKTRSTRFSRFRKDVVAAPDQIVHVSEYMHPRVEEFCDLLPPALARTVLGSSTAQKVLGVFFGKGRRLPSTKLRGFLPLYMVSALKPWRRRTYKYHVENQRIEEWLALIEATAPENVPLATEIARMQRLIKGYGDTHARGLGNFERIRGALSAVQVQAEPATALANLAAAALADEEGRALDAALAQMGPSQAA